jgi:uncharacterized membrane protein YraQ (UPF0718 family)
MGAVQLTCAGILGAAVTFAGAAVFGWEYLLLAPVVGSLAAAAMGLIITTRTETRIRQSIWAEDLNDRHERLRDLLNDCPIRRRPLVIDRDGRIIGGR